MFSVGSASVDIVPNARGFQAKLDAALRDVKVKVDAVLDDRGVRAELAAVAKDATAKVKVIVDDSAAKERIKEATKDTTAKVDVVLQAIKAEAILKEITKDQTAKVVVQADGEDAQATLDRLKAEYANQKFALRLSTEDAAAKIARIKAQIAATDTAIKVNVDNEAAQTQLAELKAKLEAQLGELKGQVDLDAAPARAKLAELQAAISHQEAKVKVDLDEAAAKAKLAVLEEEPHDTTLNVKADTGGAESKLTSLGNIAGGASGRTQALVTAGAAIGPAIVPAAAAAAAAIAGIGSAAVAGAAGIGVLALGFSGVLSAVQAVIKARTDSAASAAKDASAQVASATRIKSAEAALANVRANAGDAARRSAQAVVQAQQGVTAARQQAAQGIASALAQESTAERNLKSALDSEKQAQLDLTAARKQAKADLQDLTNSVVDGQFAQRQAVIDVRNAFAAKVSAETSGNASQREQAQLNYEEALQHSKELELQQKRLNDQKTAADKAGVGGAPGVTAAQKRLAQAHQAVLDARAAEAAADKAITAARIAGAQQINQAEQSLANAEQARTAQNRQSAYSIAQAQQTVQDAYAKTGTAASASTTAAQIALGKLTPQGRALVDFITGTIIPGFEKLRSVAQAPLSAGLLDGLKAMGPLMPVVTSLVGDLAGAMGDLFRDAGKALGSPFWVDFFTTIRDLARPTIKTFGDIVGNLAKGFGGLLTAFAPIGQAIGSLFEDLAKKFADFGTGKTGALQTFLDYVIQIGPQVVATFGSLIGAAGHIIRALAPLGSTVLGVLQRFGDFISRIPIDVLTGVAEAVVGVVLAVQGLSVAGGIISAVAGAIGLLADPVVLVAAAIAGVGFGVGILYAKFKPFHDWVNAHLLPVLKRLGGDALSGVRDGLHIVANAISRNRPTIDSMFHAFKRVADFIVDKVLPLLGPILKHQITFMADTIALGIDAISLLWKAQQTLARVAIRAWDTVTGTIRDAWHSIRGFLVALGRFVTVNVPAAFRSGVAAIGRAWDGLKKLASQPISFIINTVLNAGIIKAFNTVVDALQLKSLHIPNIVPPRGLARGGILPGFTPLREGDDQLTPMRSGEGVYVSEAMRDPYEVRRLHAVNRAALAGQNLSPFQQEGYAAGGITNPDARVRVNGQYLSRIAVAQLRLAEKLFGTRLSVMQGGYGGRHIAASGTSHNYPGVADVSPGSIATEKHLRQVGFAAWARNVAHRSRVGSGAHVHAVSLIDPGDRRSAQVTGSWPNHGNGLSGYHNDPAPHYAWVPNLLQQLGATNLPALGGGGGGGGAGGGFIDYAAQLQAKFVGTLAKLTSLGSGPWAQMAAQVPRTIATEMINKAKSFVSNIASSVGNAVSSGTNRAQGLAMMLASGWGPGQWDSLNRLWTRESHWQTNARNPSSGAYGIPQSLPASKMRSAGADYLTNPRTQIRWGLDYIKGRYGSPAAAWLHEIRNNWYDGGGWLQPGTTIVHNNTGKPEPVLNPLQWQSMRALAANGSNGSRSYLEGATFWGYTPGDVVREARNADALDAALHPVW